MPATEDETDCELWSRKWELSVSEEEGGPLLEGMSQTLVYCGEPECALYGLLAIVAIPVTSFIVSGSIVIVGNTVHWVEEQGTCDDSMTQEAIGSLVESTESAGGKIVKTVGEFVHWVKQSTGVDLDK